MTKKKSSPNASVTKFGKNAGGLVLFVVFSVIGAVVFHLLLIIGVLAIIGGFFDTQNALVLMGTGAALLAVAFLGNLVANRVFSGKWKVSWPTYPGM